MISILFPTRIYYKDVDQMGVVYYSRYLEYFEAARTELLRKYKLDVTAIEAQGFYLPVVTSHCDYMESARFDDKLVIDTAIKSLPKARLRIDYTARSNDDTKIYAIGYTEHCFINRQGKPVRPPKFFMTAVKSSFNE